MFTLGDKRNPELSGTYRFRWHHAPSKGDCGPAFKLVPPDFEYNADKREASSSSDISRKEKKKKSKKRSKSSSRETYNDLDLAVKNEPHSEAYLAILAQREGSRKAREMERVQGLEALPPITDDKSATMLKQFLEDQERKDYALKEKELDEDNAEKLRKYKSTLARRQQRIEERIIGGRSSAQEQKATTSKVGQIAGVDVACSGNEKAALHEQGYSEPKRTTSNTAIPCTCSRTCQTTQRSPKPKGDSTASIKNRRAQQQLASDIELLERKFEEEDNRKSDNN